MDDCLKNNILNTFKDYLRNNYTNPDMSNPDIYSNIHCSRNYLNNILYYEYNYTSMKYVEYFRILQAMEIISTTRLKKVYSEVGYKSTAVFSKAFIRATGFPPNCFYADEIEDYLYIIPSVCKIARNNPKEAIKFVLNYDNGSIRNILLAHQQRYKSIRD